MATYEESGVSIAAGDETVERIKALVKETFTAGVVSEIGAFGAFFAPDWKAYDEPVLVSSVDGVGTKLMVANLVGRHDTVGQDLVNHCVNDIAVCGADPLFFMDYFATGKLVPDVAAAVVGGFATACRENGCALIGGEIAEMPGMYRDDDYDLAGTIVGMVDRKSIIDGRQVSEGDVLVGLPSTGLHTNGYSLARHVLLKEFTVTSRPDALGGRSIGEELLQVHRSYLAAIRALKGAGVAKGLSHVTGGGLVGNTERILPKGLDLEIDWGSWQEPAVFNLIRAGGGVPEDDMRKTFNLGVGLIAIISSENVESAYAVLRNSGENPFRVGRVVSA